MRRIREETLGDDVLAIDQGTTSTRAILFRADTSVAAVAQREFPQHFPADGEVEHEPEDLWATTVETCRGAMRQAGATVRDIVAIGITNQRETTFFWERSTGRAVHRAIVWQDRRTADLCAQLKAAGHEVIHGQDRTSARSVFFRHQARLAVEHVSGAASKPRAANSPSARSIAICSGGSPAAKSTPPMRPMPRARCCSISMTAAGTTDC